jgi:hypothetical protein
MTLVPLLSALSNLGQETDFWNSSVATRGFWIAFGTVVVLAIATLAVRQARHARRLHHS